MRSPGSFILTHTQMVFPRYVEKKQGAAFKQQEMEDSMQIDASPKHSLRRGHVPALVFVSTSPRVAVTHIRNRLLEHMPITARIRSGRLAWALSEETQADSSSMQRTSCSVEFDRGIPPLSFRVCWLSVGATNARVRLSIPQPIGSMKLGNQEVRLGPPKYTFL